MGQSDRRVSGSHDDHLSSVESSDMIPRQFGHYHLEMLLGTGGMGEVYRAQDLRRNREVALKLLPEMFSNDEEYTRRFRRESLVAARLREPHVVPIHDFGEIDGRLFIDMRLVDGADIRSLLDTNGPLTPERAVHLIDQIAEALDAAHADGLVHRDIKPSNVLVTARDFVYVVDFGIARSIGAARTSLTMTGATVGTLDYMAPERFSNRPIDCRADVYSLACLLHECLTGTRPFPGDDLPSLMYAHLYTSPPVSSRVVPGLPASLDAVVARGMAKQPEDRYESAGELATAAREALKDRAPPTVVVGFPLPVPSQRPAGSNGGHRSVDPLPAPTATASPGASGQPAPPRHRPGRPPAADPAPRGRRRHPPLVGLSVLVALSLVALVITLVRTFGGPTLDTATGGEPPASSAVASSTPAAPASISPSIAVPAVGGSIDVGPTPGYIQVAPNGRFAYICNRGAGVVTVLDTTINQVTATIPIPQGPPQFVSFSPDGRQAYVSIYNDDRTINLVAFLDTATNTVSSTIPVGRRPFASATTPDGRLLYVPIHDEGRVEVIDVATATEITQIPVKPNPHWVVFGLDGRRAYTANHESGVVTVLDAATNAIIAEIPVGKSPHSTTVSPDGTRVAVVNYDSDNVSVIDTSTNVVVATVPVGANPQDITYAPDGRHLYTANVDDNSISVVNTTTNLVSARIPIGDSPTSISVLPNGRLAYVTLLKQGTVRMLDIAAV